LWKSCGLPVEKLWTRRHEKKYRPPLCLNLMTNCTQPPLSRRASLDPVATIHRIVASMNVLRYEEQIAGRTYFIEVSSVSASQWRAQIARRPGMPSSMMPFYGQTPEEAAKQLSKWLAMVLVDATVKS
jgi:hypothetical protein